MKIRNTKRTGAWLSLILSATVFTGCGAEPVEILPSVTSETATIECTVDSFYDVTETKRHVSYNVGYGYMNGTPGYALVPGEYESAEEKHYVYLKDSYGNTASFEISADCMAALIKQEGRNITVTYTSTENVLFTKSGYEWNGFTLEYSALVETETTTEQEEPK